MILKKLVYFREGGSDKHLRDCAAVLEISQIDRSYIDSWAGRLGVESIWRQVLEIVDSTQFVRSRNILVQSALDVRRSCSGPQIEVSETYLAPTTGHGTFDPTSFRQV